MNSSILEKDIISQPELWKLSLMLSAGKLDVALYPPVSSEEIMWRSFTLDPQAPSMLKALEDVVYANPLLLSDFKRIDCIIDYVPQLPLPKPVAENDRAARAAYETAATQPDEAAEPEFFSTADSDTTIMVRQDAPVRSFLQRTFFNLNFDSRLAALCRFFVRRPDAPAGEAVYAIARDGVLTLIAVNGRHILCANKFTYVKEIDAVYYILAAMQSLGLNAATTPVHLRGLSKPDDAPEASLSQQVEARCFGSVGPLPFPTLRYRATRTSLQAPYSLLIRPLCE